LEKSYLVHFNAHILFGPFAKKSAHSTEEMTPAAALKLHFTWINRGTHKEDSVKAQLSVILVLAACASSPEYVGDAVLTAPQDVADHSGKLPITPDENEKNDLVDPWVALNDRLTDYEKIQRDARARGMVIGLIRGTLLGAVVAGEQGAVVGAVMAGALGLAVADTVTSNLIQEHKNYLVQRNSIEAVIAAAQADTLAIQQDVDLLKAFSGGLGPADRAKGDAQNATRQEIVRADVMQLVTYAEERTRNLVLVTAMLEAQGSDIGPLQIEQKKQQALHLALRQATAVVLDEAGEIR
jgi:hypothetical protein